MRYPPLVHRVALTTLLLFALGLTACEWLDQSLMPCEDDTACFAGWHCGGNPWDSERYCVEGPTAADDDDATGDDDDTVAS